MVQEAEVIALDTNIFVYAHRSKSPEHGLAQKAIELASRDPRGFGVALSSITEFLSIVTHQPSVGRASTPREAWHFFSFLQQDAGLQIWRPQEGFTEHLCQLATDLKVNGVRLFDLQIGLTAFENGATEIWTHDKNFVRLPGLRLHDPLISE